MNSFVIKMLDYNVKVAFYDKDLNGFHYKLKKANNLKVKEIIIVAPELISKLVVASFSKHYKKILAYYLSILENDEGDNADGSLMIALDEIARLRSIIIRKYQKFLDKKTLEKMLKKLKLIENEIRMKIIDFKLIKEQELGQDNIEEKSKSR